MQEIAKNNGFEISKIVPLWFDAYYISILSEQMNDNRFAFVKGLLVEHGQPKSLAVQQRIL